jgi:hypothetical protein
MDEITKDEIALVIKEMDKLTETGIDIFFVGSIASIIGYDTSKQTNDADTYNSISTSAVELWNKACEITGVDLKISQTSVFLPPDQFEDRCQLSDISTPKVRAYYMEKHDFAISKLARGLDKDFNDIQALHEKSPLSVYTLIDIFFDEFLFTVATGRKESHIITLKAVIERIWGDDVLEQVEEQIDTTYSNRVNQN